MGVFRFQRDVARHKPDLVFLDFSANDDIYSATPETLASYEALVRRILTETRALVVQVIFPFQWNVAQQKTDGMLRRDAHLAISRAYHTAVGDAITLAQQRVRDGRTTLARLWPVNGVHPCDAGYELFADAAWDAFRDAVRSGLVCTVPEKMLYASTYMKSARVPLASLGSLPAGWRVGKPNLVSAYFDMLMSRWLDDEVIAGPTDKSGKPVRPAPWCVRFSGSMVLLFGESTPTSGEFRVILDGKLVPRKSPNSEQAFPQFDAAAFAKLLHGKAYLVQVLAEGLDPAVEHTLRIEPILVEGGGQELRMESLCVAGGEARVTLADAAATGAGK